MKYQGSKSNQKLQIKGVNLKTLHQVLGCKGAIQLWNFPVGRLGRWKEAHKLSKSQRCVCNHALPQGKGSRRLNVDFPENQGSGI